MAQRQFASAPSVRGEAERIDPKIQHGMDMADALRRRDVHAFVRLLPADPGRRHDELAAHRYLATAARASALDIVRQILAWYPDLARPAEARAVFGSAVESLIRSWRGDDLSAREQGEPLAGPPVADRIEALRYLLEWGGDPNGGTGPNPLVLLALMPASEHTARAADLLVQAGGRNVEWNNTTPLRQAAELSNGGVVEAVLRSKVSKAELDDALVRTPVRSTNPVLGLLLAHGADVNTPLAVPGKGVWDRRDKPYPAAYMAVEAFQADGDLSVMKMVLQHGADPNRAFLGVTPLMEAVHDPEVLRLLLGAGADPHPRDVEGLNALMKTRDGDDESIRMLLDRGSTVRMESVVWREGQKPRVPIGPVAWALIRGNDSLAAALVSRQAPGEDDCGAAYYAAQAGATDTLRALSQRRVSLTNVRDDEWLTPFMIAAKQGKLQTVRFFLDQGIARPDETIPRRPAIVGSGGHPSLPVLSVIGGESVLDIARRARQDAVVEELRKRGAR